jgi:hypothetical protein
MTTPTDGESDNSIAILMPSLPIREADSRAGSIVPQNTLPVTELKRAPTEALGRDREAAIITSVRAGLRVFPLAVEHITKDPRLAAAVPVEAITSALLRTAAISWVSGAYPTDSDKLSTTLAD